MLVNWIQTGQKWIWESRLGETNKKLNSNDSVNSLNVLVERNPFFMARDRLLGGHQESILKKDHPHGKEFCQHNIRASFIYICEVLRENSAERNSPC